MPVTIGIARETAPGERRVALTPETCTKFIKAGAQVRVERGAGAAAGMTDDAYAQAGAQIVDSADAAEPPRDGGALENGRALGGAPTSLGLLPVP